MKNTFFPLQNEQQSQVDEFIRQLRWCPWAIRSAVRGEIAYIDANHDGALFADGEAARRFSHFLESPDAVPACVMHASCDAVAESEETTRRRACGLLAETIAYAFQKAHVPDPAEQIHERQRTLAETGGSCDVVLYYPDATSGIICNALTPHHASSQARHALWLLLSFVWRKNVPSLSRKNVEEIGRELTLEDTIRRYAIHARGELYDTGHFWLPSQRTPEAL